MAWRFKASKYKNAAPIVPKPEACVRDIIVGSYQTYGNNITASAAFMAFNVDHNGSSLAVLPIDDCGRKSKTMPLLHAHTDTVTDMEFSPFHDGLLATGSQDCHVKVWHIPENGVQESIHNPECTFHHKQRRVETVCFHPTADNLLTSTSFTTMTLWDILSEKELLANCEHPDVIQSLSWNKDGVLLATSCKDRQVRVLDPRLKSDSLITNTTKSHQSIKESRVVWLGDTTNLITTGFDSGRQREVSLRDIRNFKEPVMTHTLDSSTGVMMPLFDPDTNLLFLAAKGDTIISCMEVTDRSPYLIEGIRHHGEQTKGACLVPKRALNVMQGEVNRVLQLTSSSVIPIMYQVPRKSYREFHTDLFPDTAGCHARLSATQWWEGHNASVPRISLDPAVRAATDIGGDKFEPRLGPKPFALPKSFGGSSDGDKKSVKEEEEEQPAKPVPIQRQHSLEQPKPQDSIVTTPTPKRTSTVFGQISKFRLLKGTPLHKSTHIENIRNVSRQISGECDGFHANPKHVAVPLAGLGGKIAIFDLKKTGKLPDGVIPTLVQGNTIMDFAWDPFNFSRLAVACDDGIIKIWLVPEEGLTEPTSTPEFQIAAHSEKIYFIKFHPLAKDVLASASYDLKIRIWDLTTQSAMVELLGHKDQMFNMSWSPCGAYCATVCRDGKLRVYNPRQSNEPVNEGKGPAGSRGARVVWALDGNFLVVSCFDKASERQIQIFKSDDLSTPLNTIGLDVSPALLIPFYDEDSSTLFLTGKGDSTIYIYEVTDEAPYLCPLTHHRCTTLHQGLSFLPKNVCDVRNVEFARALRLANNTIEPLSFTVPRVKVDLFQDDIFPPTKETWNPVMTSTEWFSGANKQPRRISLKPEGMDTLSSLQGNQSVNSSAEKKTPKTPSSSGSFPGAQQPFNRLGWNPDMSGATKQKQDEIQRAVSSRMEVNLRLEQDSMEGVDDKEWDE